MDCQYEKGDFHLKNSLRKNLALLLCGMLAMTAVLGTGVATIAEGAYTPGTYTAEEKGFGGAVTVAVTVDADKITAVEVTGADETPGIGSNAIDQLPAAIVEANTADVDSIASATITSDAIKAAVNAALAQAKGEVTETAAIAFTPGTYVGNAKGYNGNVQVTVTFTEDAITSIEVTESKETAHVGDSAYPILTPLVTEYTTTGLDVVSGATFTSNAFLAAIEDAAMQAGCDVKALRAGAKAYVATPGDTITDTYDVVVVGAGGAGMAAAASAAQNGATVLVLEKSAEMGGNTLVAGGSYQSVQSSLVWDAADPEATEAVFDVTGETVTKVKSDAGRLATLNTILNWDEKPFDETVADKSAIHTVEDYELSTRGVHAEYLPTLLTLKAQIAEYIAYADAHMAAGERETDLTLFSTIELHIFQTYYGGIRLNAAKDQWIYGDFDHVSQICTNAPDIKAWYIAQGGSFINTTQSTLIGCLWQRINRFDGGTVDGVEYAGKWGTYFKVPENTVLKANEKNNILYRTTATELITDGAKVTGVKAVQFDGTQVEITATKGVIIATGGYGANIQMVLDTNDYWTADDLTAAIKTTNRSLAQGEGIVMGQAVGAAVTGMGWTQLMPLGWVDNGNLAGGNGEDVIYISPSTHENAGKRYVDESGERDVLSQGAYDFGTEDGVYIELANGGDKTSADNVEGRTYYCTLEEAAAMLEIDAAVIEETITGYDHYIIGATTVEPTPAKAGYRSTIGNCEKDADGHYLPETYSLGTIKVRYMAPSTHHTMGGLVVDTEQHVLNENGEIIDGLFATGEVTGGFFAGNRLGGNAITEIFVTGRIAGEVAAQQ